MSSIILWTKPYISSTTDCVRPGTTARRLVPRTSSAIIATTATAIHSVTLVGVYQLMTSPPNSG